MATVYEIPAVHTDGGDSDSASAMKKNRRITSNVRIPMDIWLKAKSAVNRFSAGRPPEDTPSLNDAVIEALNQWIYHGCKFEKLTLTARKDAAKRKRTA